MASYLNTSLGFGFHATQQNPYVAPDPLDVLDLEMWWDSKVVDGSVPHASLPAAIDADATGDAFRPNISQPQDSYESSYRRPDPGTLHPPMHLAHSAREVVTRVLDSQRNRITAEEQGTRPRSHSSPGPSSYNFPIDGPAFNQVSPFDAFMNTDWNQSLTLADEDMSSLQPPQESWPPC